MLKIFQFYVFDCFLYVVFQLILLDIINSFFKVKELIVSIIFWYIVIWYLYIVRVKFQRCLDVKGD